ncbi:MAG: type II toxin-antitoxin system HicB family antitoxin [Pyrinomonadaceae bacterium]|nr:type II toxin-antitoxin system HicB family antitoxin [Pyrinomonadaceae bacterium]
MSSISLRLPDSLHEQARKLAKKENVSINQLITLAVAEKVSALMTEDYLEERAKLGNRKKFERAMAKVAKIEPEKFDRLPS